MPRHRCTYPQLQLPSPPPYSLQRRIPYCAVRPTYCGGAPPRLVLTTFTPACASSAVRAAPTMGDTALEPTPAPPTDVAAEGKCRPSDGDTGAPPPEGPGDRATAASPGCTAGSSGTAVLLPLLTGSVPEEPLVATKPYCKAGVRPEAEANVEVGAGASVVVVVVVVAAPGSRDETRR